MPKYQIKCLDHDGRTSRTYVVRCKDLLEAQRMAPASANEAVLIRPLSPLANLPPLQRGGL